MKYYLVFLFFIAQHCVAGQTTKKGILFFPPDSASNKNNTDSSQGLNYKVQYESLKHANVELDVATAILNKDFRIISIGGFGMIYPGLESDDKREEHLKKYGFKVIEGTSDVVNPVVPGLQSVAFDYAKKYNTLLFHKLGIY